MRTSTLFLVALASIMVTFSSAKRRHHKKNTLLNSVIPLVALLTLKYFRSLVENFGSLVAAKEIRSLVAIMAVEDSLVVFCKRTLFLQHFLYFCILLNLYFNIMLAVL